MYDYSSCQGEGIKNPKTRKYLNLNSGLFLREMKSGSLFSTFGFKLKHRAQPSQKICQGHFTQFDIKFKLLNLS